MASLQLHCALTDEVSPIVSPNLRAVTDPKAVAARFHWLAESPLSGTFRRMREPRSSVGAWEWVHVRVCKEQKVGVIDGTQRYWSLVDILESCFRG